jgi:LacI family transcriptional regulator
VATIRDVAKLAGVGVATASRAISGKGSVSPETAARVEAAVAELHFRPSSIAKALSERSLGAIGLVVSSFQSTFWAGILAAVDGEVRGARRHMVVATCSGEGSSRQRTMNAVGFLIERDCDGIVLVAQDLEDEDLLFIRRRVPQLVVVNRAFAPFADACFSIDHCRGGALAAQALLEHGHRRFAIIAGPWSAADNRERIRGFKDELSAHDVDVSKVSTIESDFTPNGGWHAASELRARDRQFTGLFCANDEMALGALTYLRHVGINVPHDVSVVGYDNVDTAGRTMPRLSTVNIPWEALTRNATRWLIDNCYGMQRPVERSFPVSMMLRDSVAHAPLRASP